MFEIVPDDVAKLDDSQLRTLVGLLCEAEVRNHGFSAASVKYGGNQNAGDGGLDVRVSLPRTATISGFIPRPVTGFQVKKPSMPPSQIKKEMKPRELLRPVISDLADCSGAYVIISAESCVSDSALSDRIKEMSEAVEVLPNRSGLFLDFYDRTRLATWVRGHPSIIVWARNAVGRKISGWEAYAAWAHPASGLQAEYLVEQGVHIVPRPTTSDAELSASSGLEKIRAILREPGSVVRLVGLSGLGKTRFVQALFDERVGASSLNPALAIYTNMNNSPDPKPTSLASDLVANGQRAILIIDNCAADLHRELTKLAKASPTVLSVLTVEYDIRDDQPEDTDVYEIKPASVEMIEKLLTIRHPRLSSIDARTAAQFSGGNARIGIALAEAVSKRGTLSGLTDEEVFQKLFMQRQHHDAPLLEIAQACSLVYSFQGEDLSGGPEAELAILGNLIRMDAGEMFAGVSELLDRDLAQRRGQWRAILPHALANRLASNALRRIPREKIETNLLSSERLAKSFTRRIGYLHSSKEAIVLVRNWLGPDGWIRDVWNLSDFGKTVFSNILSVDPEAALDAIEVRLPAGSSAIIVGDYLPRAIRAIAYDAKLFDRAEQILCQIALRSDGSAKRLASDIHASLFWIYLSGTHADVRQRINAVRRLVHEPNQSAQELGLAALSAMLKAGHFMSHYEFSLGARSRDHGYLPKTTDDLESWYGPVLNLVEELSTGSLVSQIKTEVANHFRELWSCSCIRNSLQQLVLDIARSGFWPEGWAAVRQTRYFDAKDLLSDDFKLLTNLEERLRPLNLVQEVRGRVLFRNGYRNDFDPYEDDHTPEGFRRAIARADELATALGADVAADEQALGELLPEILSSNGRLWEFGAGLATCPDPKSLWDQMRHAMLNVPEEVRNLQVFRGFLHKLQRRNPALAEQLLDRSVNEEPLAAYLPILQTAVQFDRNGVDRLMKSLAIGKAKVWAFENLRMGRATDAIDAKSLAALLLSISEKEGGLWPAIRILYMRYYSYREAKQSVAPELIAVGRQLISNLDLTDRNARNDHDLCEIAKVCLVGESAIPATTALCNKLIEAFGSYVAYAFDYGELLERIFACQPNVALDAFLANQNIALTRRASMISDASEFHRNPIDAVPDQVLIDWCLELPSERFASAAAIVTIAVQSKDSPPKWSPTALLLMRSAPDAIAILRQYVARFRPMSWSGSLATILERNVKLLDQLDMTESEKLAEFITVAKRDLLREAEIERNREAAWERKRDERFE